MRPLAEVQDEDDLAIYRNINSGTGSGELKFKDLADFEQLRGHEHDEDQSEHDDEGHHTANQEAVKLLLKMVQT